jgi:hypothetical protein
MSYFYWPAAILMRNLELSIATKETVSLILLGVFSFEPVYSLILLVICVKMHKKNSNYIRIVSIN